MALIKCPECGKEISDKAPACIHCGCPIQPQRTAYQAKTPPLTEEAVQRNPARMSRSQTVAVIILTAISVFIPLLLIRNGLYSFSSISFVLSLITCAAVVLLAVFQPKKKALYCVIALTINTAINFVVPQFLYRESLTIMGLLNYAILFSLIVIYWLSAAPVINNSAVPIVATIGYAVFGIVRVFIASTYGRYMFWFKLVSVICDVLFYSSGCIIICDSVKHRQLKLKAAHSASGNYVYVQDAPSTGFAILCFCFPIVGLILYCVWHDVLPQRAKSAGIGGLVGFVISIILIIIFQGVLLA